MLSVIKLNDCAKCHYAECRYAKCHFVERRGAYFVLQLSKPY
jgi:hypothetical protein